MSKAISSIIGTLLILIITISLFGFSYSYISGVFTSKTAEVFYVVDALNDTVTISNDGTAVITNMRATLDGNSVSIAVVPNIQGLVGYWSFNEGSGSTTDDNSGNRNIGTLRPSCPDCPVWIDGKYVKALQFDGSNDYVNVLNNPNINMANDISVFAWIKTSVGKSRILGKGECGSPGFSLATDSSNRIRIGLNSGAFDAFLSTSGKNYNDGQWHFVGFTRSGSTVTIYGDGIQDGGGVKSGSIATSNDFIIGGGCGIWPGLIDEVSLFNRALSNGEVSSLYSGLVVPGQLATIKSLASLSQGSHTLRLCSSSMCNTAILRIN